MTCWDNVQNEEFELNKISGIFVKCSNVIRIISDYQGSKLVNYGACIIYYIVIKNTCRGIYKIVTAETHRCIQVRELKGSSLNAF